MRLVLASLVAFASGCSSAAGADDELGAEASASESSESGEPTDLPNANASESESESSDTDTGEPACPEPAPCMNCLCMDGDWYCGCPTFVAEAYHVGVPANDYALVGPDRALTWLAADAHRQFVAFQPSAHDPIHDPIFVFFNGGPAVSTGMLLGLNIGPKTFDPDATAGAELADNPHRWTELGSLLWIDARQVGFSYGLLDDPSDPLARADALSFANFNAYRDAADFVMVLLEVLGNHPELRDNPIVLVAESYGGTRAQLMLDMLLHPQAYATGERKLVDAQLVARITAHHEFVLGVPDPTPAQIAEQFGHQVLIQPALTGVVQKQAAGLIFEQPGSVVDQLAAQLGLDYVPCSEKPQPCRPYDNALAFVSAAGRSGYDTAAPTSWLDDLFTLVAARCSDRAVLEALLDVPIDDIPELLPAARAQAWRIVDPTDYPSDAQAGDLADELGALAPWDRYYLVFEVGALARFRGSEAKLLGVDPDDPHFGEILLHDLAWVDTLITSAERDLVVHTPALPDALASYATIVDHVDVGPGEWTLHYRPDAFPELPGLATRTIRVPSYAASHAVSMDAPAELLADVASWLD